MKWALAGLVLLALAGLGLKWVLEERARTAPAAPSVNVQSTWATFREAPGHRKHVGEMALDCTACHQEVDGGADRPGPERCATCHADQAGLHHGLGEAAHDDAGVRLAQCTACHGFGPDPQQLPGDCLRCHAEPQGDLAPVTVHAEDDCLGCHVPHEDRVEQVECAGCHQVDVEHGRAGAQGQDTPCTTCHDPHAEAAVASERCAQCHGAQGALPIPESAVHAGQGCAGCHQDHRFTRATVTPCSSCHQDTHVLPGKGHQRCSSCHDPHALKPAMDAAARCQSCHRNVKPRHGDTTAGGHGGVGPDQCIDCHAPHPQGGETRGACLDCHALARNEAEAHGGGVRCAQCHVPHAFDTSAVTPCTSCHVARLRSLARHAGHAECAHCHTGLPHVAGAPPEACGTCHEGQQAAVHAGHAQCDGCHDPHAIGKPRFACAGCHQPQAAAVGPGHAACGNCHDPHSGERAASVSDCSSCHDARRLPGLHGLNDHQTCATCHSVHGEKAPAERATCLSCHSEQRDHQPEASQCNGCHTFRAPGVRRKR